MREVKVITAEAETIFEEKFKVAIEEVEAMGKIVDIRFTTNATPIKPGGGSSARLYYSACIIRRAILMLFSSTCSVVMVSLVHDCT